MSTNLSPDAQTVLNAFLDEWDVYAVDKARYGVAAALRAAALQLGWRGRLEDAGPIHVVDVDDLLDLAAELEGQST